MKKIDDKIALSQEVLAAIPKNTPENKKVYITEVNKIYAEYQVENLEIIEELKQRRTIFEKSIKTEQVPEFNFEELRYQLKIMSPVNTPYEKLGIDVIIEKLDDSSSTNFSEINKSIFKLIKIFNQVGIQLTSKDFYYNKYQNLYMSAVLNTKEGEDPQSLKTYFENYYWKNPNIIKDIKYNFKSLYHQNVKSFNKYINNLQNEINKTKEQITKEYLRLIVEKETFFNKSKKFHVDSFVNGTQRINDYSKININKIGEELIEGDILEYSRIIHNFNDTLKEYKNYLYFKPVLDKIKENINSNASQKKKAAESSNKLKEIIKLEAKLKQLIKKDKGGSYEYTQKIHDLYQEYDQLYYKEKLLDNVNAHSKIIDAIYFLVSYFSYYLKIASEIRSSEGIEEPINAASEQEKLLKLYFNPYADLVNNFYFLKEYDIERIIIDKYKLDNIKLEGIIFDEEIIDNLIDKTNIICNYYNIEEIEDLDINQIDEYIKIINVLNSIE